ncbi:GntR family transcriptional regulator [Streptomyces sp. NPDC050161]|uniref:GntR family transcriptional regulator n=1 Tax=Streptomyces sp. NPDC050161 TaxID=3365604 RepID=UPI0037AD06DC
MSASTLKSAHFVGDDASARLASALAALRRHIQDSYSPGDRLPGDTELAVTLRQTALDVRTALRTLDTEGVVATRTPGIAGALVLAPDQLHPHDLLLDQTIRKRIISGYYRADAALPVGVLAWAHGLSSKEVMRGCRRLLDQHFLRHDEDGAFGPGLYINRPTAWGHATTAPEQDGQHR